LKTTVSNPQFVSVQASAMGDPAKLTLHIKHRKRKWASAAGVAPRARHSGPLRVYLALFAFLFCCALQSHAQSPTVIQGPSIFVGSGITNVSVIYPSGSPITQNRVVLVPQGAFEFQLPVSYAPAIPVGARFFSEGISVVVNVTGPNPGETTSNTVHATFSSSGSTTLTIPINVDWSESIVSFDIGVSQSYTTIACWAKGCVSTPHDSSYAVTGPSLASIPFGISYSQALTPDAFLVVVTPAAAFQLPVLPVAILYSPLGNGKQAKSAITLTDTTGTNQQISTTTDQTYGYTSDDKTSYQAGVTLDFGGGSSGGSGGNSDKVSVGYNFSGQWDNSVENDTENLSTQATTIAMTSSQSLELDNVPAQGQPPLNEITASTQPFWNDIVVAVADPQFAVWGYPAGSVIQPLGSTGIVGLPIAQLDSCRTTPQAVEPASLTPSSWEPGTEVSAGAFDIGVNSYGDPISVEVAITAGTTGSSLPAWPAGSAGNGATTLDGTVTWMNEYDHLWADPGSTINRYIWLDSLTCTQIANLDAFYAAQEQSASLPNYDLLEGPNGTISLNWPTDDPVTYTNDDKVDIQQTSQEKTTTTIKTTSVGTNSQGVTGAVSNLLGQVGINLSLSNSSSLTTVYTAQSTNQLGNGTDNSGEMKESTTIDDTYAENLSYNVLQDSVFDGLGVQVPSWNFPVPPGDTCQDCLERSAPAGRRFASSDAERAPAKVLSYANKSNPSDWMESHLEAASRHTERPVPDPRPGYAIPGAEK
jgi:hypothetical protein